MRLLVLLGPFTDCNNEFPCPLYTSTSEIPNPFLTEPLLPLLTFTLKRVACSCACSSRKSELKPLFCLGSPQRDREKMNSLIVVFWLSLLSK